MPTWYSMTNWKGVHPLPEVRAVPAGGRACPDVVADVVAAGHAPATTRRCDRDPEVTVRAGPVRALPFMPPVAWSSVTGSKAVV